MKYVCVRKNGVAALVCGTLSILVVAFVLLASFGVWIRGVLELAAMLIAVADIQISQRYLFSSYELILDPEEELLTRNRLTVIRVSGKNRTSLLTLPLTSLVGVEPYIKRKKLKERIGSVGKRYSFCTDMLPKKSYLLIFDFNDENTVIRVECDEAFASELEKRMAYKKRGFQTKNY